MVDPEVFGALMGDLIREAVAPLQARIVELEKQVATTPSEVKGLDGKDGQDGKDCDMEAVRAMISDAVKSTPIPKDGLDGKDGKDGVNGEKGADGSGIADLMIDRDGGLVATFTDGRMKNLGSVVGKDGENGKDGTDGLGLELFEMEYLPETHEVHIKASCAGRSKEVRYPAGGIHAKGYWREGVKASAGDAWTHDGCLWVAKTSTSAKPETQSSDWFLAARKGRDGERGQKGSDGSPPAPIKLKD